MQLTDVSEEPDARILRPFFNTGEVSRRTTCCQDPGDLLPRSRQLREKSRRDVASNVLIISESEWSVQC